MKTLYPEIEPFDSGMLKVSDIHTIYWERVGNPDGIPLIFLHGGPGGGLIEDYRRYFDPEAYHVILFDQRGSGRSTPHAELEENTTWDLIKDIETLREKFSVDKWYVFGGSWGSTLSLAYAISHPDRCLGLILRGIFLTRRSELEWFYQKGASEIFPDFWERFSRRNSRSRTRRFYFRLPQTADERRRSRTAFCRSRMEHLGRFDIETISEPRTDGPLGRSSRSVEPRPHRMSLFYERIILS